MFQLVFTVRFRKDVKLLQKRGFDMDLLKNAIIRLESNPAPIALALRQASQP